MLAASRSTAVVAKGSFELTTGKGIDSHTWQCLICTLALQTVALCIVVCVASRIGIERLRKWWRCLGRSTGVYVNQRTQSPCTYRRKWKKPQFDVLHDNEFTTTEEGLFDWQTNP